MNIFIDKILGELKAVPITLMFMMGVYVAVYILWTDHVSKNDFNDLKVQLYGVKYTLERDHVDTRLHATEQEIFTLTQHVTEERDRGHPIDRLYDERIDDLKNQHESLMRDLARLDGLTTQNNRQMLHP